MVEGITLEQLACQLTPVSRKGMNTLMHVLKWQHRYSIVNVHPY